VTPVRIAALGYYGFGNLGDEAVLGGIRRALQAQSAFAKADLLVLSHQPKETLRLHPGVRAVDRWQWRTVADSLKGTDLFILGGGSLLQDATSTRSVIWYTLMALLARRRAKRLLWWGQGVGPLNARLSHTLVRGIANQADYITVRDTKSAELLKGIGAKGSIEVVADPAFALEPDVPTPAFSPPYPETLLCLRHWETDSAGQILHKISRKQQKGWEGVPMHLPDDETYMTQIWGDDFPLRNWQTAGATLESTLGLFAEAKLVVAMRLHALIFAARCGTPFVALSYDPKVEALAKASRQEDALLSVNDITAERLTQTLTQVRDTASERRERLRDFSSAQQEQARIPAQRAVEIL
jgi:polysaccharide pyruvyl transferase CsaB